jgi:PKD repeat protein
LTVTTDVGSNTRTREGFVLVNEPPLPDPPLADFTAWPTSVVIGQTVQFIDMSTAGSTPIETWSWDFGDGQGSMEKSPTHTYNTPGVYTVALVVTSSSGFDSLIKENYITVTAPGGPTANFMGVPTTGTQPLTVTFSDMSLPGDESITSWLWDFGDGGTSDSPAPVYTYLNTGVYTVTLTVQTAVGSDQRIREDYIQVTAPQGPTAYFNGVPTGGMKPLTVQFVDLSLPGNGTITDWLWQFGDGASSTESSPTHVYENAGSYTVQLTVTTEVGDNTQIRPNYINVTTPGGPNADFTAYPASGTGPLTVQFASQSIAGDTPITNWSWEFGDGGTSTAQAPRHTYNTPGTYSVRLAVTAQDSASDEEFKTGFVVVAQPATLTANFTSDVQTGPAPLTVQFFDTTVSGSLPVNQWLWQFGDGATSEDQHPSHTYHEEGVYTVKLTATTASASDTVEKDAYITVAGMLPAAGLAGLIALALSASIAGAAALRRKRR